MTQPLPQSFMYEHCDVPDGIPLTDWRSRSAKSDHRRAQLSGGMLAALATLAPIVLSVRGSRRR